MRASQICEVAHLVVGRQGHIAETWEVAVVGCVLEDARERFAVKLARHYEEW